MFQNNVCFENDKIIAYRIHRKWNGNIFMTRPGIFRGRYHLEREKISLVRYIIKGSKKQRWVVWGGGIAKISHKTEGCLQQLKIFEGGKS